MRDANPAMMTSVRETTEIDRALEDARRSRQPGVWRAALEAACAHPCAGHTWYLPELLTDLARARAEDGEFDAAIEAQERAIAVDAGGDPHPRADIGSFHLMAGRTEQAAAIYAEVRELDPDSVWLRNHVGMDYADAGDHETAVRWFEEGLELAMRDGDPEQIVDQLAHLRSRSLEALGRDPDDELSRRARRFVAMWKPPPEEPFRISISPGDSSVAPEPEEPCPHCGWTDDLPRAVFEEADELLEAPPFASVLPGIEVAVAWLPRDVFGQAIERWPELRDGWEDGDHAAYSARIEVTLREVRMSGAPVRLAPVVSLDGLVAYCEAQGIDPASGKGRSRYAAELLRAGEVRAWPPGRNEPCWCGSRTKYKRCCGRL